MNEISASEFAAKAKIHPSLVGVLCRSGKLSFKRLKAGSMVRYVINMEGAKTRLWLEARQRRLRSRKKIKPQLETTWESRQWPSRKK
jgi:hypothetical protein